MLKTISNRRKLKQYVRRGGTCEAAGFTLIEILTALVVIGVATSIFLSLYTASMSLSKLNRAQRVAALLAEESLADIVNNPSAYEWHSVDDAQPGDRVAIRGFAKAEPPAALPTNDRAYDREENFYYDFTLESFAVAPEPDAAYVHVAVTVRWSHQGSEKSFTLSSTVPRSLTKGVS